MTRDRCVDDQKAAGFPVKRSLRRGRSVDVRVLRLAGTGSGRSDERQVAEAELVELMRDIFEGSDGNYGVPRMHDELRRAGLTVNEKRVRRLMRLHGMAGRCRRRRCQTTFPGPDGYHIPDLVGRCFEPARRTRRGVRTSPTSRPGKAGCTWRRCSISARAGCSGYSMADHMRTELVLDALGMAVAARGGQVAGVIGHADRGRSTPPTTTSSSASSISCAPRLVAPGCAGITRWPSRSGSHSSVSACRAACSPPAPRPAGRSSAGSTGTTPPGCTPASTASRPPSGNSNTVKRHNHPSAGRGDGQRQQAPQGTRCRTGGPSRDPLRRASQPAVPSDLTSSAPARFTSDGGGPPLRHRTSPTAVRLAPALGGPVPSGSSGVSAVSVRHDALCERNDERRRFREVGHDLLDESLEWLVRLVSFESGAVDVRLVEVHNIQLVRGLPDVKTKRARLLSLCYLGIPSQESSSSDFPRARATSLTIPPYTAHLLPLGPPSVTRTDCPVSMRGVH